MSTQTDDWLWTALQLVPDAAVAVDAAGRVVALNRAAEGLTGWAAGDATGRPAGELLRLACDGPDPAFAGPGDLPAGTRLVDRGGRSRPVTGRVSAVGENGGRVVTLRDESGARPGLAERRLAAVLENIKDPYIVLDRDWNFVQVNQAAARAAGLTEADLIGKNLWTSFPEYVGSPLEAAYRKAVAEQVPVTFELAGRLTRRWLEFHALPSNEWLFVYARDVTERKQAEEVRARHAGRLALLAEAAEHLLTSTDPQSMVRGVFEMVSAYLGLDAYFNFMLDETGTALRLDSCAGIPPEAAAGIDRLDFDQAVCGAVAARRRPIVASDVQASDDPRVRLIKGFGIQAYACHPLMAGGRLLGTLSFGLKGRPRFTEEELEVLRTVCHLVAAARERVRLIAEANAKAEQLAASERRLSLAQRAANVGTFDHDLRTGRVAWSEGIYALLGVAPGAAEERPETWDAAVLPDDRPELTRRLDEVVAAGTAFEHEFRIRRADGAVRWVATKGSVVRGPGGAAERLIGVNFDVTDRREAEEAVTRLNAQLAQRVRELQTVLDTAPVGINIAADRDCRVITGNAALAEMVGMDPGANISKSRDDGHSLPYTVWADGKEVPTDRLPMQRAAAGNVSVEGELLEFRRADGRRLTVLANARPVVDEAGAVQGAVGVCTDVTRLLEAEEALREANRRKDEFLAMLAHELRNPLAAVGNGVRLLTRPETDAEGREWATQVIGRQVTHLSRLIDDLLDVSRVSRGKIVLRKQAVDAATVIRQAAEVVQPLVNDRNHRLEIALDSGLELEADPARLEQVLVNLLTNAAKYTDPGGLIRVEAGRADGYVTVTVRDNGVGIPPERLPEMFELFAQGDRSLARSEGGLGIGLTLVKSLTELHGGSVTARSEGTGRGSEFTVRFPVGRVRRRPAERRPRPSPDASAPTPCRVLVVDDNADSARALARLLRLLGHEVRTAHAGPEALELARSEAPEVVLLDIGLPGMDGYEVASRLRREPGCAGVRIIAVSGYGQDEHRNRSRAVGIDHHLLKPVDHDALLALLAGAGPG